ncbi:hypothetical protein [Streptomyces sp. NBC_00893]|uniref:hypothetical protein n=1 Tax=Streptomyces sp. NBC_00893 TaxID=2975862 RepID=UPI0022596D3A|nr:hypothetical protein [Streptomyces sp. NBC_00893]MCX4851304.1 copper resistance protein CopC [Streptomyces sp. NBC_00893]
MPSNYEHLRCPITSPGYGAARGAPEIPPPLLIGSDPRDGAVPEAAPKQITANFDESVALSGNPLRMAAPDCRPVTVAARANVGGVLLTGG